MNLASFHSLAASYGNKFKRIDKHLINMPAHLPRAAKTNSFIRRTKNLGSFGGFSRDERSRSPLLNAHAALKQLAPEGQLVAFWVVVVGGELLSLWGGASDLKRSSGGHFVVCLCSTQEAEPPV